MDKAIALLLGTSLPLCAAWSKNCPQGCSGNGDCYDGVCFCDPYHLPPDCSTTLPCPNNVRYHYHSRTRKRARCMRKYPRCV